VIPWDAPKVLINKELYRYFKLSKASCGEKVAIFLEKLPYKFHILSHDIVEPDKTLFPKK
jgi:hypothetical protein